MASELYNKKIMKKIIILVLVLAIIILVAFFLKTSPAEETAEEKNMKAVIKTNLGDITLELFSSDAPVTVANFAKLSREGFYEGVKFHRVIKDFMIQGGDPLTKNDAQKELWGTGGPGYKFKDEIYAGNRNLSGTIAMANAGPDTNGSQFFINTKDNNYLNQKHTVFGKVTEGLEVVQAIGNTPVDESDCPVEPVVINSIEIQE